MTGQISGILLILACLFQFSEISADQSVWWIFFSDRGSGLEQRIAQRELELDDSDCLYRRLTRGSDSIRLSPVTDGDLLPCIEYMEQVCSIAEIRTASRYLNAVSVNIETGSGQLEQIRLLPFISSVRPVARSNYVPLNQQNYPSPGSQSIEQLSQIGIPGIHSRGWFGSGVIVGVLDSGFDLSHIAFNNTEILDEYDFVAGDSIASPQQGDPEGTGVHGAAVLSLIGGYQEGIFSGGAPGASFLLMRTEDISDEYQQEEDYWVAGLEWAEEKGADIISSSLGYIDWYTYEDLDGNTAVTTIAADSAAQRGLLVVNSIGNGGPEAGSLIAPADGDQVLSVGGVDHSGTVASFSSRGPTYDGRIKPDVMALGQSTVVINYFSTTGYLQSNGTSFACPLISSIVAILIETHPDWGPVELIEALQKTASSSNSPDNDYGWGIADCAASMKYRSIIGKVVRSDNGELLQNFPLKIFMNASGTEHEVQTNETGWFAFTPDSLGGFVITGGTGATGEVLQIDGVLEQYGLELAVYVDMPFSTAAVPVVFPNPSIANEGVYIGFDLEEVSNVSLSVFSLTGTEVYSTFRTAQPPGSYRAPLQGEAFYWNSTDKNGNRVSTGIYFARMVIGNEKFMLKIALVR